MSRPTVVFRPTVVIGLGGTGYEVVLKLKKRFIDVYGSVPEIIQFLSIDTTENIQEREKSPDGNKVILEPNELYAISVANPIVYEDETNTLMNGGLNKFPHTVLLTVPDRFAHGEG